MSEEKCRALGLTPRARFVNFGLAGDNPQLMLTAPIPATQKVLQRAGMNIDQMDLVEINEAFLPHTLTAVTLSTVEAATDWNETNTLTISGKSYALFIKCLFLR